ncbi:type IX secretion system sortase PorU [Leadbetterella byssophila]|uniref:type IX secretion system sortase PorU n=1 Tax=Leadbetterella byssophila TaxID=316068 RepID=UPI0039A24205
MRIFAFLIFLCTNLFAQDTWLKLGIEKAGVYKIDQDFIKKYAPHLQNLSLEELTIMGGHPKALPQKNSDKRIVDWEIIPTQIIEVNGQAQLFFFAEDPHEGSLNPYSKSNFYFLGKGEIKKIPVVTSKNSGQILTHLGFQQRYEKDEVNLLQSGRLWLGELFKDQLTLPAPALHFHSDYQITLSLYPMGISRQFIEFTFGTQVKRDTLSGAPYHPNDATARYHRISNEHRYTFFGTPSELKMKLSAESVGNVGVYLDYWEVKYQKLLKGAGEWIFERTPIPPVLQWDNNALKVWQIGETVKELGRDANNLIHPENRNSRIVAFSPLDIQYPLYAGKVIKPSILNLPVPELLIVYPRAFQREVDRYISFKKENENIDLIAVDVEDIYLTFSSGKVDPTAIRDFCRHLYRKDPERFSSVLLIGDATYDYRNLKNADYVNLETMIPTYESRESLEPIYSYSSDDYFGFLEDHEGDWPEGRSINNIWFSEDARDHTLDISVGRIPARNLTELSYYVDKYMQRKPGTWMNKLSFIADNRDYNLHQQDAEDLERRALENYPGFNTEKLLLDDFPIEDGISPKANARLHEMINQGSLVLTYIGHGSSEAWTNEKLLHLSDISKLKNSGKLPIWLTATCEFGRFDQPGQVSGAEYVLLSPQRGGIALLTTTRPVYSSTNQAINRAFFQYLPTSRTLGEAFRKTKNASVRGEVNRNFSLLGDPTLPLPYFLPEKNELLPDLMQGGEQHNLAGAIEQIQNGEMSVQIMDTPIPAKTIGNFPDSPAFNYEIRSQALVEGRFEIKDFKVSTPFIAPNPQQNGKTRALFQWTNGQEIYFSYKSISLTKLDTTFSSSGPELSAALEDNKGLIWYIRDQYGIKPDFHLEINGKKINHFTFVPTKGFQEGILLLPLSELKNGKQSSTLIASNIYNITAQNTFEYEIKREALKIQSSVVYPNPVKDFVRIKVKHNRIGENLTGTFQLLNEKGQILQSTELECMECLETWDSEFQLENLSTKGQKLFLQWTLKSAVDGSSEKLGRPLFFWK